MKYDDFIMLEPLLTESLQDYLARHGHRVGDGRAETPALTERWRTGPAWAQGVVDWRTREQKRWDKQSRAQTFGEGEST